MTPVAALLTACGLLAALVARFGIARPARGGGVAEQLRRLFSLIAMLLALRLANFAWTSPLLAAGMMVVAAWLPLAMLRLSEELVRRHAPRWLKFVALGGAVTFSLLAGTLGLVWTRAAIIALALFQGVVMAGVLAQLQRERGTLPVTERKAPDLLALTFLVIVPLAATDFAQLFPDLVLRGGPFAVLLVMLACSRLAAGSGRPLGLMIDIGLAAGVAGLVALGASLAGVPPALLATLAACGGCGAALLLIIERFARHSDDDGAILPCLAGTGSDPQAILAAHPLLSSAIPLAAADLSDLPAAALADLARRRVVAIGAATGDDEASGAARELLKRHAATHLLRRSQTPPNFLAICGGALNEERLTTELDLVARLLERSR